MKMMIGRQPSFIKLASDIIQTKEYKKMKLYRQHGTTSAYHHCLAVAYISFRISRALHLGCNERSLVRGALLHDFFLYDWHTPGHRNHAFLHPLIACKNAEKAYTLTSRERDIITKHMFPISRGLPRYRESYLVSAGDKICTLIEFVSKFRKTKTAYRFLLR